MCVRLNDFELLRSVDVLRNWFTLHSKLVIFSDYFPKVGKKRTLQNSNSKYLECIIQQLLYKMK